MARPRNTAIDGRVMAAAAELVARSGVGALSITGVAREAGVSRPTVYRRWPTVSSLRFELGTSASVPPEIPDLGTIHEDLPAALEHLVATMVAADRAAFGDHFRAIVRDPEFGATVRRRRWDPDRERGYLLWTRAVERGEVLATVDGRAFIDDLVAICLFRVYLLDEPPDRQAIEQISRRLLVGVLTGG